jgi:hypothetical protein
MDSSGFFLNLMFSLDAGFLSQQGLGPSQPDAWGNQFFQELSRNHPQWVDRRLPIYMKASEILHYFAFFDRAEEIIPAFHEKPQALLRMVLMLLRFRESDPLAAGTGVRADANGQGNRSRE